VNALKSTNGSSRAKYWATTPGLNLLEVFHIRLGHASGDLIKWIVKSGVCDGLDYTYDQIKHLQPMKSRMKAFPIPPSMTTSTYFIFEYITLDIIHLNRKSCRGYKYSALFVEKFAYHLKRKSDLVTAFNKLLRDYHPQRFPRCLEMRILHTDFDSLVLGKHFNDILVEKNIRLRTSAPYKHQKNLAEHFVSSIKDGIRTVMAYNNDSNSLLVLCHGLPRINETRNKIFFGVKPDLSHSVLFYSSGYYHICPKEQVTLPEYGSRGKAFVACFAMPTRMPIIRSRTHTSFLTETGSIVVRRDRYFRHFTPFPICSMRRWRTVVLPRSLEKIQSIMMTYSSTSERTMTPQTGTIYKQIVTTLTMISYSVKPSTVPYHFNPQYYATHGVSKKLPRVYNETRTKFPLMMNLSYRLRRCPMLILA
jgi:hypothetical protein